MDSAAGSYNYTIVANDGKGDTVKSTVIVTVTAVPVITQPVLAAIAPNTSTTGDVTLTWTTSTGVTSYLVYRSTSAITSIQSLAPIANVTQLTYKDTDLENGTYFYAIVAVNASGTSGISNCISVVVAIPQTSTPPHGNTLAGYS